MEQYILKINRTLFSRCVTCGLAALLSFVILPVSPVQADIWEELVLEYGLGGKMRIPIEGIVGQTIMKSFILEIVFTEPKLGDSGWYQRTETFYTANCRSYDYHPRWTRNYDSQSRVVDEKTFDPAIKAKRAYVKTPIQQAIRFACSNGKRT